LGNLLGWVTLQNKLQKLQNRAAPVLTFSNYDVNAEQLPEILGWKNLDRQGNIQKVTIVFKFLHGLAPDYLVSQFSERNTSYNLRDSENKLNVRLSLANYVQNGFIYSGAFLMRPGAPNPSGRSNAKLAKLYKPRHSRKAAF